MARERVEPKSARFPWLLSIFELPRALQPGDELNGHLVYEVKRLDLRSTNIAGRRRRLFAVLHAGANSLTVCVLIGGRQREWTLTDDRHHEKERG